jgi:ribosomal protein L40E
MIEMSEDKTCPKCGSKMLSDKKFGSGAVETSLFTEGEFRGDDIKANYCRKCEFIELYRKERKRLPTETTEKELWDYSDTQE